MPASHAPGRARRRMNRSVPASSRMVSPPFSSDAKGAVPVIRQIMREGEQFLVRSRGTAMRQQLSMQNRIGRDHPL